MEEKAIFSRRLLYKQKDKAYSEVFESEISAISAIYAFSWVLPGMQHPITTRARIGIIYDHNDNDAMLLNPTIEFWKNENWVFFDDVLRSSKEWSPEKAEQEALFMSESFLMGVDISSVRERYGHEIVEEANTSDEVIEEGENVLKFPKK